MIIPSIALMLSLAIRTAQPPPIVVEPAPLMYLTTEYAAPVLVFDNYGNGTDVWWTDNGQTYQASIYVWADGQDWLYIHDALGRVGWVKYNYDTMRMRFENYETS